jgi:hypothetical protein
MARAAPAPTACHRRVAHGAVLAAWLAGGSVPWPAIAFELVALEAGRDGEAYELRIEAVLDAAPEALLEVLTDYDRIHELHPRMAVSRSLGPVGPGTEEVQTSLEGCVLVFCRTLYRVEHIRRDGATLIAEDVPARSAFREGRTVWRLAPEGRGTRLRYQARFVPAFWVPPVIGPGALSQSLERMVIEMLWEAERRAGGRDG